MKTKLGGGYTITYMGRTADGTQRFELAGNVTSEFSVAEGEIKGPAEFPCKGGSLGISVANKGKEGTYATVLGGQTAFDKFNGVLYHLGAHTVEYTMVGVFGIGFSIVLQYSSAAAQTLGDWRPVAVFGNIVAQAALAVGYAIKRRKPAAEEK